MQRLQLAKPWGLIAPMAGGTTKLDLKQLIAGDKLPSLPQVAARVVELAGADEPDLDALIETVKLDPAVCGKLLRTANCALFGLRQRTSSVEAAVPILGATLVRTLVLGFSLAGHRPRTRQLKLVYQKWWRAAVTQAVIAESLAESCGEDPPSWFLAGLLQDIGQLALIEAAPEQYVETELRAIESPASLACESEILGLTHIEASVYLCREWNLDESVTAAVAAHHSPIPPDEIGVTKLSRLELALRTAAQCAQWLLNLEHSTAESVPPGVLIGWRQLTGESDEASAEWLREIHRRTGEVAALLDVDLGESPLLDRILQQAQSTLAELAVAAQMDCRRAQNRAQAAEARLTQLERQSEEIEDQIHRDPLTRALNRRFLDQNLTKELERSHETLTSLGLLFVDLDKFKELNDHHGHSAGDAALQCVAEVLHQCVRETDYVIRYGGDEFVVLLVKISPSTLQQVSTRILRQIRDKGRQRNPPLDLGCSIGVLHYDPTRESPVAAAEILHRVDQCMYHAKRAGGNQTHMEPSLAASDA